MQVSCLKLSSEVLDCPRGRNGQPVDSIAVGTGIPLTVISCESKLVMLAYYIDNGLIKAPVGVGEGARRDACLFFEQAFVYSHRLLQFIVAKTSHTVVQVAMPPYIAAPFAPQAQVVPAHMLRVVAGSGIPAI